MLTWVEISKNNLLHNLETFKEIIDKKVKLLAVVKSNAYGHGLAQVAKLVTSSVNWFGVNDITEGLLIRQSGIKSPVLILGYVPLEELGQAILNDLSFVVYNDQTLVRADKVASNLAKKAKIHLKLETGTNRQGLAFEELDRFISLIKKRRNLLIEGVYTHFADIEDTSNPAFFHHQLSEFKKGTSFLNKKGINPLLKHTAATSSAICFDQSHFDLVRIGIGLYGLWPVLQRPPLSLKPVLAWKTKVAQVKTVKKNQTIGYGRTFTTKRATKIAVLPIGYWDGYDRGLSNMGRVIVGGKFAPIVGRICMNMSMVDVTGLEVKVEDEVVILGKMGNLEITADEMAQKLGTINYEVVTRINPQIPRVVV